MDYLENLMVDPTAHIAPSATVIGDVTVDAECTVLQGATIRGDFGGRIEQLTGANPGGVDGGQVIFQHGENVVHGHAMIRLTADAGHVAQEVAIFRHGDGDLRKEFDEIQICNHAPLVPRVSRIRNGIAACFKSRFQFWF